MASGGLELLAPEQILHACMILSVESDGGLDENFISLVQEALGCDDEDHTAALEHIDEHRDDGNWGGRRDAVLNRSADRAREALSSGSLPEAGEVADGITNLLGGDDDDGEIDPFAELGVQAGAASTGGAAEQGADLLAAFMDDDDEEEEMVDSAGFLAEDVGIDGESEPSGDDVPDSKEEEPEPEKKPESDATLSPLAAYEMLMSTCWVDGILDPAEAKLLARKRGELGITFDDHLSLLRKMLERES